MHIKFELIKNQRDQLLICGLIRPEHPFAEGRSLQHINGHKVLLQFPLFAMALLPQPINDSPRIIYPMSVFKLNQVGDLILMQLKFPLPQLSTIPDGLFGFFPSNKKFSCYVFKSSIKYPLIDKPDQRYASLLEYS